MQIILGERLIYEGQVLNSEEIAGKISKELDDKDLVLEKLFVNGVELVEETEAYLNNDDLKINDVIEVQVLGRRSYLNRQLRSTLHYLKSAVLSTGELAIQFYQGPKDETWSQLTRLLEEIQQVAGFLAEFQQYENLYADRMPERIEETAFEGPVDHLQSAIDNNDSVWLADILQYELFEVLKILEQDISYIINFDLVIDNKAEVAQP